jgi:hypothetical protein
MAQAGTGAVMHIGADSVGAEARVSAVGASEGVTMGGTWDAATGDTWDGTGVVLGGPTAQVWAVEVVDQGVVADLLWVVEVVDQGVVADLLWVAEDADQGVVADLLWAAEAVVAGRAEVLSEQEVAEPGPEVVARVLVEAGAPEVAAVVGALEVAEVEVLAEAVVAAVAVKPSQGPRTDCGPIEGGDAERLEKVTRWREEINTEAYRSI